MDEDGLKEIHEMHKVCQEITIEISALQRELWAATYDRRAPDVDKIMLSAVEASQRNMALLNFIVDMRQRPGEM